MKSEYHIIENHNRTFTVMFGRAVVSTHRTRDKAKRVIIRLTKRNNRRGGLE